MPGQQLRLAIWQPVYGVDAVLPCVRLRVCVRKCMCPRHTHTHAGLLFAGDDDTHEEAHPLAPTHTDGVSPTRKQRMAAWRSLLLLLSRLGLSALLLFSGILQVRS